MTLTTYYTIVFDTTQLLNTQTNITLCKLSVFKLTHTAKLYSPLIFMFLYFFMNCNLMNHHVIIMNHNLTRAMIQKCKVQVRQKSSHGFD